MSQTHEADRLIEGLEILKRYKPSMSLYSSGRVKRTLEIQETEFLEVTDSDRSRLLDLGWETQAPYLWRF